MSQTTKTELFYEDNITMVLCEVQVTFDNCGETRKPIYGFTFFKSLIELRVSLNNLKRKGTLSFYNFNE